MSLLRKIYSFFLDIIQSLLIAAAVFLVIYAFLFRPFQVTGSSMHPTFKDQQYVLTSLISLRLGEIKRGDVIVFQAPIDPNKDFIKRVIALPGETISLKNGEYYVNNVVLDESSYLKLDVKTYPGAFLREGQDVLVPKDEFFVSGDNRSNSSDSREWGLVPKNVIIGKSFFVYWPPNEARLVKNPFLNTKRP